MTEPLHPNSLTWAALLGRWLDLAAASTALTEEQDGPRWRLSLSSLVTLQAIVFALEEFDQLPRGEQPVALDRSEVLVNDARMQLEETWGPAMPAALQEALDDAEAAIDAIEGGMVWILLHGGDEPLHVPVFTGTPCSRFEGGTLALALPGTVLMPGSPIAWWIGRREPDLLEQCHPVHVELHARPLQVWRVIDEEGRFIEDRVTDLDDMVDAAMPLLAPLMIDGQRHAEEVMDAATWSAHQEERMPDGGLDVVWTT